MSKNNPYFIPKENIAKVEEVIYLDQINLRDEIRNTDDLLGKKFDWETEKYETKYLQEVSRKEGCRVM